MNLTLIESLYQDVENQDDPQVRQALVTLDHLVHAHPQLAADPKTPSSAGPGTPLLGEPQGLRATLRHYQLEGFNWLVTLHRHHLGACLADDMGLGKTVQTISLLEHLRGQGELGPSLLITPVVTLSNWEEELSRFAPGLGVYRHTGQTRLRSLEDILSPGLGLEPVDIILVSYHTLRNDLDIFVRQEWDYVILDEAHYIKNSRSQLFKSVKVLRSRHRLSLTGTPIENSTMELWSQFNFLNPGLLGSRRHFQTAFALPIEKEGNEEVREQLRKTIRPFILRRRKEEVLADLPPKEEILHWIEMDSLQKQLYNQHREELRTRLEGLLHSTGKEKGSMEILRFMLRLRQIAIHPGMVQDNEGNPLYPGVPSCKQEALNMLLDECLQEDHKILVFSQFVRALNLVGEDLDNQGKAYQVLSGSSTNRGAMVRRFREDDSLRIFLLSLKAGGVGINLTEADYVVLFDPWWNPAAERQAVDRAHRMGQKRPVIVYRFITRGTIEEKILLLQKQKHDLAGSLISDDGEDSFLQGLSEAELMDLFS